MQTRQRHRSSCLQPLTRDFVASLRGLLCTVAAVESAKRLGLLTQTILQHTEALYRASLTFPQRAPSLMDSVEAALWHLRINMEPSKVLAFKKKVGTGARAKLRAMFEVMSLIGISILIPDICQASASRRFSKSARPALLPVQIEPRDVLH